MVQNSNTRWEMISINLNMPAHATYQVVCIVIINSRKKITLTKNSEKSQYITVEIYYEYQFKKRKKLLHNFLLLCRKN